jgi:hypothetical protein
MVLIPGVNAPPVQPPDWLGQLTSQLSGLPNQVESGVEAGVESASGLLVGGTAPPPATPGFSNPFRDLSVGFAGFGPYVIAAAVVVLGIGLVQGVNPAWGLWLGLAILAGVLLLPHTTSAGTTSIAEQLVQLGAAIRGQQR